ncbi:hypothetical protein NJB18091_06500 [Mycobacterium marinum]|nr:hypothetical protein NJB18091_06500 [Mycobacterium marinum]
MGGQAKPTATQMRQPTPASPAHQDSQHFFWALGVPGRGWTRDRTPRRFSARRLPVAATFIPFGMHSYTIWYADAAADGQDEYHWVAAARERRGANQCHF